MILFIKHKEILFSKIFKNRIMAKLVKLPTYNDNRGNLTVIEKILPFEIKRVYYIYGVKTMKEVFISIKTLNRH